MTTGYMGKGFLVCYFTLWCGLCSAALLARDSDAVARAPSIAFVGVHVVPMDRERILRDYTVLVEDETITQLGPAADTALPPDTVRVELTGKYLMPGLMDMHVQMRHEGDLSLYLANGVTTIRLMAGGPRQMRWRDRVESGNLLGPTIITSGPVVGGMPHPDGVQVTTETQARTTVGKQKSDGYDFISVLDGIPAPAYHALMEAARRNDISVAGPVQNSIGLIGTLAAEQHSIEHLSGYWFGILSEGLPLQWNRLSPEGRVAGMGRIAQLLSEKRIVEMDLVDAQRLDSLVAATRESETWNSPTFTPLEMMILSGNEQRRALSNPEVKYLHPEDRTRWEQSARPFAEFSPETLRHLGFWLSEFQRITKSLHDAGCGVLLGTGSLHTLVIPGFSIRDELRLMVDAGLTPYEALRAGTRRAAEFLSVSDLLGTVEIGKRADLILLSADPLKSVANLNALEGVVVRGEWLSRERLNRKLDALAESYR